MGKLFGAALLSAAVVGGAAIDTGVVVIDIHAADGPHIVVPVPLVLARAGLAFAPDEARRIEAREFAPYLPYAERILDALREAPDGTLVEVVDGDDYVNVAKKGDAIHIRALEGRETAADVVVPLRSAEAVVRAYDVEGKYFRTSRLVAALRFAPRGDLVDVRDGDDRVRIRRLF